MGTSLHIEPLQSQTIELWEEQKRNFWASKLGVSVEKLKSAVRATHSVDYNQVKDYLALRRNQFKTTKYVKKQGKVNGS